MQKIATRIFVCSSIAFGIIGILIILAGGPDNHGSVVIITLDKLLFVTVFILLPSLALSIAGKYLNGRS